MLLEATVTKQLNAIFSYYLAAAGKLVHGLQFEP